MITGNILLNKKKQNYIIYEKTYFKTEFKIGN